MNGQTPKISNLPFSPAWIPVLLMFVLLPVAAHLGLFSTFYITLTTKIFIFCVLLLGFDLLAGYTGMVSFGHAMFFGLGTYTAALSLLHIAPDIWLAIGIAVASCLLVSVIVGFLSIRTHGVYFIFITLAFAQFFHLLAFHWIAVTGGDNGLPGIPSSHLLGDLFPIDLGGLAGALFAHEQNYVGSELLHWLTSAEIIITTWLGGVGTLIGPIRIVQHNSFSIVGSAADGSAKASAYPVDTRVFIEANETDQTINDLIRMGEQTCFLHAAMSNPCPSNVRGELNGKSLSL